MTPPSIRTGQGPGRLSRAEFGKRYQARFTDRAFDVERDALARLEAIAWDAYQEGRKAPSLVKAGPEFADPSYDISTEWLTTRAKLKAAAVRQHEAATPDRVLCIIGSARNDDTCPSESSKTWRLAKLAESCLQSRSIEVDLLDLSLITSEFGRTIHPCKGCVSTAMPLCHYPCTCYPNHALGQVHDMMAEVYERWTAAHGVILLTPVYWLQAPSPLKLMIDRLVCADGGNLDPTTTSGKDPDKAKQLELAGWPYPQHLAGRVFGVVVHGDTAGIEGLRRALTEWLEGMGLVDAGAQSRLDRFVGYFEDYASSHEALDRDLAFQEEVKNVALAVANAVADRRSGGAPDSKRGLVVPRPK